MYLKLAIKLMKNDDILSLVIQITEDCDLIDYDVYNINKSTGEPISNSDMLSKKGIDEESFLNSCKTIMGAKFKSLYSSFDNTDEFYQTQFNNTISADNVNINIPMFLDSDGTISIVAKIYALAGGDSYNYLLDTGL